MNKRIRIWFKWRRLRFYSSLFYKKPKLTPDQIRIWGTVRNLTANHDTDIYIAPLSGKVYLSIHDVDIIVAENEVSIINGVYHYVVRIDADIHHMVINHLYRVIERRRLKHESRILAKVEKSLDSIYKQTILYRNA